MPCITLNVKMSEVGFSKCSKRGGIQHDALKLGNISLIHVYRTDEDEETPLIQ